MRSSPSSGGCWDVASKASLTHNGGGDSQTIINMVKYAVDNYGGGPDRVYATGTSSGAMIANVLVGAYPNMFKAVTAYSGVPDGSFYVSSATAGMANPGWSNKCANGQPSKTAQAWGDLVRVMIWHGTADTTLKYFNSKAVNLTGAPESAYTESICGDGAKLVGFSAQGVGHNVPVHESIKLAYYDL
ncbi:Alpha/Beta hydrolase protein [Tricladium varicosporioides]|nr:Alpha/Beta hydrolase protein [Hymenoscyphus varicosporioides]